MKPAPFQYHRPATVSEAVALLSDLGDTAKVLAGGQSLIPMLALRLTAFDDLVDIGGVPDLVGIENRGSVLHVGAATRYASAESDATAAAVPLLAKSLPLIGHFQIRNRGTVGGSIAHADAAAELPAVALALDATMHVASAGGTRDIAAAEFFAGFWTTTLESDELLTGVSFPIWNGRTGFAVEEFARRHGDFALAGTALGVELDGEGKVSRAAIGLIALGSTPERAAAAEAAVVGRMIDEIDADEVGRLAVEGLDSVPSDLQGSADYRKRVGAAMVAKAWTNAVKEAANG